MTNAISLRGASVPCLFEVMQRLIAGFRGNGRIRTAETYTAALNSFRTFLLETGRLKGRAGLERGPRLSRLTPGLLEAYEAWILGRGNCRNTSSFYMRIIRAVYNRAVDSGMIVDLHPFARVFTGVAKTSKRAVPGALVRKIRLLGLPAMSPEAFARDMFMLSFYLRGMSFVDMAYLRKSDLRDGYIVYRRRKTGRKLTIAWTDEMQTILDRYPANPTQYLLPIISRAGGNDRVAYLNKSYTINRSLRKIGSMVGLSGALTLYVARHSWASIARAKGVPLSIISEGMGHESESTTRIYLATLDTRAVDRANAMILRSV